MSVQGIIGRKVGMTQVYAEDGRAFPVTVIEAGPCVVVQRKSREKDGYVAVQLGLVERRAAKRVTRPMKGHFEKAGLPPCRVLREFRLEAGAEMKIGDRVSVSLFAPGDLVDVTGMSKGHGFTGTIARHHFKRGPKTHGSTNIRAPGSIGAGTTPGRVFKGTKMGGHMGDDQVTVKRLIVERVDNERNLLLVKGAVPGARNGLLLVQKAK